MSLFLNFIAIIYVLFCKFSGIILPDRFLFAGKMTECFHSGMFPVLDVEHAGLFTTSVRLI